jgi:hypothetical protein
MQKSRQLGAHMVSGFLQLGPTTGSVLFVKLHVSYPLSVSSGFRPLGKTRGEGVSSAQEARAFRKLSSRNPLIIT